MIAEAWAKGFDNAISLDDDGFVAKTASSNVFIVKDGAVRTPVPNGTFLNGITRRRVMVLLLADGYSVEEDRLLPADLEAADEMSLTGNASKVMLVTQYEAREFQPGPVSSRARALYWEYAHGRV